MSERWVNITKLGSMWEEEVDVYSGRIRHRRLNLYDKDIHEEWVEGPPPASPKISS